MKADPRMVKRRGGFVCAGCGDPLNDVTVQQHDPFCSTKCANEWHGFEPLSRKFTLGGYPADVAGPSRHPAQWDTRRRRAS